MRQSKDFYLFRGGTHENVTNDRPYSYNGCIIRFDQSQKMDDPNLSCPFCNSGGHLMDAKL